MTDLLLLTVCAVCSAAGTVLLRGWAVHRNLYDSPNHRSSHTIPTPRLGGLAVVSVSFLAWAKLRPEWQDAHLLVAVMAGGGCCAAIGFFDDLRPIPPVIKFVVQLVAVCLAISLWQPLASASVQTQVIVGLWLLAYTNFFNFMDGSDGLAAGTAACAGAGLAMISGSVFDVPRLILPVAAAVAGFLIFNYPPASIFMGDAGSLFLGFVLAFGAVSIARLSGDWIAPAIVLLPFWFDAGFTLARRALNREPVWRAHRSHLYQRLLGHGFSHRAIAVTYWTWCLVCVGLGLAASRVARETAYSLGGAALLTGATVATYVRMVERRGRTESEAVHERAPVR